MTKIRVTKEIMRRSVPGDECHCAIAEAIKPFFPGREIIVSPGAVFICKGITDSESSQACKLPEIACKFIDEFDSFATGIEAAIALDEVEFELDLIPEFAPTTGDHNQ